MSEKTALPSIEELKRFIESLTPPGDEVDEVSARIVLERAGVDIDAFPEELMARLDSEIKDIRERGEEIPPPLMDLAEALHRQSQAMSDEEALDPETHIPMLLAKQMPGGAASRPVASFRSLRTDLLTDEDLKMLQDLYDELQSRKG